MLGGGLEAGIAAARTAFRLQTRRRAVVPGLGRTELKCEHNVATERGACYMGAGTTKESTKGFCPSPH